MGKNYNCNPFLFPSTITSSSSSSSLPSSSSSPLPLPSSSSPCASSPSLNSPLGLPSPSSPGFFEPSDAASATDPPANTDPCVACKNLGQKCTKNCYLATHFPSSEARKYDLIDKIFGATNIAKFIQQQQKQNNNLLSYIPMVLVLKERSPDREFQPLAETHTNPPCPSSGYYGELWKACAGPLVNVPKSGERVFYFPQGHIDQLEASTNQQLNEMLTSFNLPSKILCRVVNIQLLVEEETDEPYAQITLLPESDQTDPTSSDPCPTEPSRCPTIRSFCKVLTPSDTGPRGGFYILRKHAIECLPPLDMSEPTPAQELVAKDLYGNEWRFTHIFKGRQGKHLLTAGWSTYVTAKRLVPGDLFVFIRGENGQVSVGVRRLEHQGSSMLSSVISHQSMCLGVLAAASHAVAAQTLFTMYYKPRKSQFIISLNRYLEGINNDFSAGKRFNMKLEGNDFVERRFSGSIIGVEDISPHWRDSKWRQLKVHWDDHAPVSRPDRVSPWEIELCSTSMQSNIAQLDAFIKLTNKEKKRKNIIDFVEKIL